MSCYSTGPFDQTIFLGCSIISIDQNLAWGGDSSSTTVNLIQDNSAAFNANSLDSYDTYIDSIDSRTRDIDTASQAFNADNLDKTDPSKSLFRKIAKDLSDKSVSIGQESSYRGKVTVTGKQWYYPDPGFVGSSNFDIIGCAVGGNFNQIGFGGMIKNWSTSNKGIIQVEIQNFASVLKNTTLILKGYGGSISTLINNNALNGSIDAAVPSLEAGSYGASIYQGNAPNVINIYGHLGGGSDRGLAANAIYDALDILLNSSNRYQSPHNPYGALVTKAPFKRSTGSQLGTNTSWATRGNDTLSLYDIGFYPTKTAVDNKFRGLLSLDLSNIPRPPDGVYINDTSMDLLSFIDYCCKSAGVDYYVGGATPKSSNYTSGIGFGVIDSKKNIPLDGMTTYIDNLDADKKVTDYKYGEEYAESVTKTIILGGSQRRLHQMTTANWGMYRHSKIFNLSQANASSISNIFLPNGAGWLSYNISVRNNIYKEPDYQTQRGFDSSIGPPWRAFGNALISQTQNNFYSKQNGYRWVGTGSSAPTTKGNYSYDQNVVTGNYNIENDMIAPYFGQDKYGSVRSVALNGVTRQLSVAIPGYDIDSYFYNANGTYWVSEIELRSAANDFKSWWIYTSYRSRFGKPSSLGSLMYDYIADIYGDYGARQVFNYGYTNAQKSFQVFLDKFSSDYGGLPYNPEMLDVGHSYFFDSDLLSNMKGLHAFLKNLVDTHYGKTYMVRVSTDGYALTDSAWEEPGSPLDDLMIVGDSRSQNFTTADGRIKPILGFNSSDEFYGGDWYNPLILDSSNGVTLDYRYFRNTFPTDLNQPVPSLGLGEMRLAWGGIIPNARCRKTYVLSTVGSEFIYHNNIARVIMSAPNGGAFIVSDNDIQPVVHELMALRGNDFSGTIGAGALPIYTDIYNYILISAMGTPEEYFPGPRAALPVFAAVPMIDNYYSYGPWASHPGIIANDLFRTYSAQNVNNLVGKVNFEIDETLVPWEYGGMQSLDNAGMARAGDGDKYVQVLQYGSLTVADIVLDNMSIGSSISNGPICSSLRTNIGPDGLKTTYGFRTYTRKQGFYNKELADNIRTINQQKIKINQEWRAKLQGY